MRRQRPAPGRFNVDVQLPFDSSQRIPTNPKALCLLMHGYGQSGQYMFDKLETFIPSDFAIVSPNAAFPLYLWDAKFPAPGWRERKVRMGYTWYFYDSQTNEYLIDMQPSLGYLKSGIEHLGLHKLPTVVIGFSQGGYVAPFAAQMVQDPRQVMGISCEFLADDLEGPAPFRVDAIFGDSDKIASIEAGKKTHAEMLEKRGLKGDFHVIAGLGHEVTADVGKKIAEIVLEI